MATPDRELGYGAVEIYNEETLGVGSYGKVCKAKCGQLPCAAKLLHDTMFGNNDPGIRKFVENFEQECRFLRMIKHPNIVQFLGTMIDPRSQRLALLMELMDESLTRFLERSTGPLPYHTQLNICHDVALALTYLHSNNIIHRDLSSNNVLLIGEGSRAKVTDLGMSKLIDINPHITPLTMCPGTLVYMPPEALVNSPRYSNKLDWFTYGVLIIQIITREFPDPTDATTMVEDARFPTGIIHVPVPERERRKKNIDLVDPNHPLLPLALHCLKDRDTERPSPDEVCGRLATLKGEQMYTRSVEQSREQSVSVQTLQEELARVGANWQQQVHEKEDELERARANHETELHECTATFQQQIREKDDKLERSRANHKIELHECSAKLHSELEKASANHETELHECTVTLQQQIQEKDDELERSRANHKTELRECNVKHQNELEKVRANHETELTESHATFQQQIREKDGELERVRANHKAEITELQSVMEQLRKENCQLSQKQEQQKAGVSHKKSQVRIILRRKAPENMSASLGSAVVYGNTAYFSRGYSVYSYTLASNEWTELQPPCEYERFGLAVVNDKVTTIGGWGDGAATNALSSWHGGLLGWGARWKELPSHMPTARVRPATVTTPTHLIVAGGMTRLDGYGLSTIEILDTNTLQWSSASRSPETLQLPHISLCGEYLYLSQDNAIFTCSVEELLKSCKPSSVWTKLTNIPVQYEMSLSTLRGQVLAIGGRDKPFSDPGSTPTGVIHCYDRNTNSWSVIGEMTTPRSHTLVAAQSSNKLIAVGGYDAKGRQCNITEIATY